MKKIVLAATLALLASPALALGPESFTVDMSHQGSASNSQMAAPASEMASPMKASDEGMAAPAAEKPMKKHHKHHHKKDAMGKDSMSKDGMAKDSMGHDAMAPAPAAK